MKHVLYTLTSSSQLLRHRLCYIINILSLIHECHAWFCLLLAPYWLKTWTFCFKRYLAWYGESSIFEEPYLADIVRYWQRKWQTDNNVNKSDKHRETDGQVGMLLDIISWCLMIMIVTQCVQCKTIACRCWKM